MNDEQKNLPDSAAGSEHDAEQGVEISGVGVSAETEAEGSAETPEDKLERIATEHDVPIEKDPKDVQAEAEASSHEEERDIRGTDTNEDVEPPD